METLIVIGSILLPAAMLLLKHKIKQTAIVFNVIAAISAITFGSIAAVSIYTVIVDDAVFMTTIHGIFLNPLFLITGAYLGLYILYRLLILTIRES